MPEQKLQLKEVIEIRSELAAIVRHQIERLEEKETDPDKMNVANGRPY